MFATQPASLFDQALTSFPPEMLTTSTDQTNQMSYLQLLSEVDQLEPPASDSNRIALQSSAFAHESLLSLDTPTLTLFNEFALGTASEPASDNLTALQMQEIDILQKDLLGLEAASLSGNPAPLTDAITVDLSLAAKIIAGGTTAANALTPAQLDQISAILKPMADAPLTPQLVQQIQDQLQAAQFNPQQFNSNTIFLVLNSLAEMRKSSRFDSKDAVAAIASTDRAAIEDSAILT